MTPSKKKYSVEFSQHYCTYAQGKAWSLHEKLKAEFQREQYTCKSEEFAQRPTFVGPDDGLEVFDRYSAALYYLLLEEETRTDSV